MKRVVLLFAVLVPLLLAVSIRDAKASYTYEDWEYVKLTYGRSYEWEYEWDLDYGSTWCVIGTLVCGFETDWINEYYAWADTILDFSYAKAGVHNEDQFWVEGSWEGVGYWSKSEIRARKNKAWFRIKLGSNDEGEGGEWYHCMFLTRQHESSHK